MNYKYKYLKYLLKNKLSGSGYVIDEPLTIENIENFIKEMEIIKNVVSSKFENYVLTGSSVIIFLLYELSKNHSVRDYALNFLFNSGMLLPHDIDFLYSDEQYNAATIGDYNRKQNTIEKSLTFIHETNKSKSFDITKSKFNKFIMHDMPIIDLNELLSYYRDEYIDSGAHKLKIDALKFIISNIDKLHIDKEIIEKEDMNKRLLEKDFTFESPPEKDVTSRSPKRKSSFESPPPKKLSFDDL